MKKQALLVAACFLASFFVAGNVVADDVVPGAYSQQDQSVMGVGRTMMEIGARDRALTDATNRASRAHMSRSSDHGVNVDQQFGSSQTDQSWKQQKTVEEASVVGLVEGDCKGDNSTDAYRKQMNQSRDGFMKEILVPDSMCMDYHPTLK